MRDVPLLPASTTSPELGALHADPAAWLPHAEDIARAQGLPGEARAFPDGSNLVAAIGERHVLKLFAPFLAHQHRSERAALATSPARSTWPFRRSSPTASTRAGRG
ncbi:MAG: hypothetical protein WKG00_16520 [Polyangiaceae bacterium]